MPTPLSIRLVVWLWLLAAVYVGAAGWLTRLPLPAVQGVLVTLTALLLLAWQRLALVRAWIDQLDLRALVLPHVSRLVGFYFLFLYRHGRLPYDFAVRGGWGDIIVATLALFVCLLPLAPATRLRAITIWNVIGAMDILFVVATAARLVMAGEPQMRYLAVLPLSLLPTFLVPLIIASHFILFVRLRRATAPAGP